MSLQSVDESTRASTLPDSTWGVRALRHPEDEALRAELARRRIARLLVIGADAAPPDVLDPLEDWIREPLDAAELAVRCETLARRAEHLRRPLVDDDGVVWFDERWSAIPARQIVLARLLVERFGTVVPYDEIVATYAADGASTHAEAVKAAMSRVGRQLASVGLNLTKVRGGGYILDRRECRVPTSRRDVGTRPLEPGYKASGPSSPVRTRTNRLTGTTHTFPSPILSVWAAVTIASMIASTFASSTSTSTFTFARNSTLYSAPRYVSV
jgi:hypothetical protein